MPPPEPAVDVDVVVIGAGQAGLATGFYLTRRTSLSFVLLEADPGPGGAWRHMWASLRAFSPAAYSSLPGWPMPPTAGYPTRDEVVTYLGAYADRYALPVHRPVRVTAVHRDGARLGVTTDNGTWSARAVVSATGTWARPFWPHPRGQGTFPGRQLHAADYDCPAPFAGQRVGVVGGGNSAAQIVADLHPAAETTWYLRRPPRFLPDDVDGRALFDLATARWRARQAGRPDPGGVGGLGDIVVTGPVRAARDRGALTPRPMFSRLAAGGAVGPDGREHRLDAVIWCTGFRPALDHLRPLGLREATGLIGVAGTRAVAEPRLWLVGYGDWTGDASATLVGVGRTARDTVTELAGALGHRPPSRAER
ncbi:ArsO family NAD(P)H-dependent flavin-containing monooxygenase [Trujillonella humicola]|uniref:ArsO family NAD(P)H-dependent flavin-containing monooxygenase n=1 Tax=Trujillonella humicola TaxID=3383699 RepID=UPI003905D8E6